MIYVMSDIHGNSERFNSVMEQINLQPEDTLNVIITVVSGNERQPPAALDMDAVFYGTLGWLNGNVCDVLSANTRDCTVLDR